MISNTEIIMRNAGLEETQAGIKISRRNINNLRYADDTTLMAESEEELKKPLDESERGERKVGLKLNIQKMKIMAPGPITSWAIDGETVETVSDFIFGGRGISLEGMMLKLKLQYFGHLMRRVDSLEKTLMLGRIGGRRRRG